jgi:transcription termination factor Rho
MTINITNIRALAIEEIVEQLQDYGVDNAGNFSASELVFELACQKSDGEKIEIEGILEVLSDGFGFLRSPISEFAPGADDAYVSPAQIRRFNLRTGDRIAGEARTPKEKERYFALLRINEVNGRSPEKEKNRLNFETKTLAIPNEPVSFKREMIVAPDTEVLRGQKSLFLLGRFYDSRDLVIQLLQSLSDPSVLILLNYPPEDLAIIRGIWSDEVFASTRGNSAGQHQQTLEVGKERAKRLVEQGKDVNLIIFSLNALVLTKQSESKQSATFGAEALAIETVQASLALGRNFASKGSLTVWAGGHQDRSGFEEKALERILYEVDHRFLLNPKQNSVDIVINKTLS